MRRGSPSHSPCLLFVDNSLESFHAYRMPLARAAKRAGFDVHVAAPRDRAEPIIADAGFTFHHIDLTRSGMNVRRELAAIVQLYRLYRRLNPHLIHHLRLKPVLYGSIAAQLARVSAYVSMPTGLGYLFISQSFQAQVMRAVTLVGCRFAFWHRNSALIFQNPDDRQMFTEARVASDHRCFLVRGSGVDVSGFQPLPEPDGVPVVTLASRMLKDKGITEFVEAAKILKAQGVVARFLLVGDTDPGNPTAVPTNQLASWRDRGLVEWLGHQRDMGQVLADSNIVCLPSYREGVPKVLIEAAASSRAIVATNVPGCREIVRHGHNGLLVEVRNATMLAQSLRILIENPALRARMGCKGRHLAVAEFSNDRVIVETLEVYLRLLRRASADGSALRSVASMAKRSLDIAVALAVLVCLLPVFLILSLAIVLTSPGPVLYRGKRVGRNGVLFHILKFRSMVADAESKGGSATASDDNRITTVGQFLRRYKLDELPQFLNVMRGEMSLVGPRPEVEKYVRTFNAEQRAILSVPPGITDWASIWNSNEGAVLEGSPDPERTYEELIRPTKLALQLKYVREQSFLIDLKILFHTALRLLWPQWTPADLAAFPPVTSYQNSQVRNARRSMSTQLSIDRTGAPACAGGEASFPEKFRFIVPSLPDFNAIMNSFREIYDTGLITNAKGVARFEAAVCRYLDVPHCVALSSCTSGLTLSLKALGLTGEIIVPSFTFFATAHSVRWNGLTPVFAECRRDTWNIDCDDVERKITARTSAILAVHMYGNPCDVARLEALASRYGLKLMFDAAHAFGSRYRGVSIGRFGDAEVFSLSPTKVLVAGEGGLVTTNNGELAAALRLMRNYGDDGSYDPKWLGANARMSEFNATLGFEGLPLVDSKVQRRQAIARAYTDQLAGLPGLSFQQVEPADCHTYKDYSIHVSAGEFGLSRDELASALLLENIETKKYFYPPLHAQTLYAQFRLSALPATDFVSSNILSLPIYETLPDSTVRKITSTIRRIHAHFNPAKSDQEKEVRYVSGSA
jgi:dTDP-4-amino-4,6-dideoxygalactose transaminase/lipopolysaccharide/colanic/teichoic acid biosynthesis glycosyltransferase/glycosyltransferase involved in cell wall biosynthesis